MSLVLLFVRFLSSGKAMKLESTALNKVAMELDGSHPLRKSLLDYQAYLHDDLDKRLASFFNC